MRAPAATITIWLGNVRRQVLPLSEGAATIGRLPDNWLVLSHPSIRRRHAELEAHSTDVLLIDLADGDAHTPQSATSVNGARLLPHTPTLLHDGDVIALGPFRLRFHARALPEVPAAALPVAPAHAWRAMPLPPIEAVPMPPTLPDGPSRYLYDLPVIYHDDGFLGRYLKIFEALWEPLEHRQDHIALYFDPQTCPPRFLDWLASWFDLRIDASLPEERRRAFIGEGLELQRWRGTHYALARAVELTAGYSPDISLDDTQTGLVVRMPVKRLSKDEHERIMALVRDFAPAHLHYQVEWRA